MRFLQLLTLAALAVGSPVPSIDSYTQMLKKRQTGGVTVTESELSNFVYFSEYAGAAYCNSNAPAGQAVTCSGQCNDIDGIVVQSFTGLLTGIGGFVAVDHNRNQIVLSIRGSSNVRNFITDILFLFSSCSSLVSGCYMHSGFAASWAEISSAATAAISQAVAANPSYSIISTGHSLGAAVATIAAAYLRGQGYPMDLYTYGSPRVGNAAFANFVTAQPGGEYRVTHLDDPVPRLPPLIFDYRHISPEYWLSDGTATTTGYGLADVLTCVGNANVACNGGTSGFDVTAHLYYFGAISGCDSSSLSFKKRDNSTVAAPTSSVDDQELIDRLNAWAQQDRELATSLARRDEPTDQELVDRLNAWSQQDQALANSL